MRSAAALRVGSRPEPPRSVATALGERMICIDADRLRAVREIIATAYGSATARAVRAAIRGGFVTTMLTHASLAEELLRLP